MPTARDQLIEEVFSDAADLPDADREAWLQQQLRSGRIDAAILDHVRLLLRADQQPGSCDRPFVRHTPLPNAAEPEQQPRRVAGYSVGAPLGSGGMGHVYAATHDATGRAVALKLLRPGLASRRYLDRFRLEAESLARLSEPRIAQLYDSGVAVVEFSDGLRAERPYIVMERIAGAPIVTAARDRNLSVRDRLALIEAVARATQHAHQRGVIHRDLKPGNILVTDDGTPKIVDFGIARLVDSDRDALTVTGQVLGTARYMSPEQASGHADAVDTRSDVFSIGAILYELLAGRPMIESDSVSTYGAVAAAATRPPRLSSINPQFRGDVDAVVHKAIELDPRDRYQSAGSLADDLARLLRAEPVTARMPGTIELFVRAARRNKPLTAAVAVAVIAMTAGTGVSLWQAGVARAQATLALEETNRANDHARIADEATADAQRRLAEAIHQRDLVRGTREATAEIAARIQDILVRFAAKNAANRQGLTDAMNEALAAAEEIPGRNVIRRTAGYDAVAQFYEALNEPARSLEWREKSLKLLEDSNHMEDVLHLTERALVASLRIEVDPNADVAECERILKDCREKLSREMLESEQILVRLAQCHAVALDKLGRMDESRATYERLIEVLERDGKDPWVTIHVKGLLGVLNRKAGRYEEARELIEAVIADRKARNVPVINLVNWYDHLGFVYDALGRHQDALDVYVIKVEAEKTAYGADDPRTALSSSKRARILAILRRDSEAAEIFEQCLPILRGQPGHYVTGLASALLFSSQVHIRRSQLDDAAREIDECAALYGSNQNVATNRFVLMIELTRSDILVARGQLEASEKVLAAVHDTLQAAGVTSRELAIRFADLYTRLNRPDDATRWRSAVE